jgi:hypothetical protein
MTATVGLRSLRRTLKRPVISRANTAITTYLEEDADISGFMVATGVDPADVVDVINHVSNYIRLTGSCWVNTLDHCSGEGFVSRFPMMFREAN